MIRVVKAPEIWQHRRRETSVFLAGSIEMGAAEMWQDRLTSAVGALSLRDVLVLNPRRDDWDSSWTQSIENRHFREQVIWELDALEKAHLVVFYFDPKTKSPITLLELGLQLANVHSPVAVCCPDGYHRKGNVDIVCERLDVPQVADIEKLAAWVAEEVGGQQER